MSNNTIFGYSGEVTLRYKHNGKLVEFRNHNDGKEALFQTLATLLVRQEYPHGRISYIALSTKADANSPSVNLLNSAYIPITQLPQAIKLEDGRWACSVNTTISSYDRNAVTPQNDSINTLTLLSSDGSELATVTISKASIDSIVQGVQLFIQWNLIIDNKSA
ncbi:MAG: hypothetical protein J6S67_00620 [Methanobrevibacter sp.]|nr:hypothetical protein [Methanobrevibacter sp.]